jgi:hypothetical protein
MMLPVADVKLFSNFENVESRWRSDAMFMARATGGSGRRYVREEGCNAHVVSRDATDCFQ